MTTMVKDIVKGSLFAEQGGLCAYCMRRMQPGTMQIEHYLPRSSSDDAATIAYGNLPGVCPGDKGYAEKFQTCDAHRGNTPLTVDPLKRRNTGMREAVDGAQKGVLERKISKKAEKAVNFILL